MVNEVRIGYESYNMLENLGNKDKITKEYIYYENITAPINIGDEVGKIVYKLDGKIVGENKILALEKVEKMNFWNYFVKVFENFVLN